MSTIIILIMFAFCTSIIIVLRANLVLCGLTRALGRPRVPLPHSMEMQARARLCSSFPYKIVACGARALTSRGKQVSST
jgi:hypothetical protein